MTKQEYDRLTNRMRRLPGMIEDTRHKLAMLEREACRYGMTDLVERRA